MEMPIGIKIIIGIIFFFAFIFFWLSSKVASSREKSGGRDRSGEIGFGFFGIFFTLIGFAFLAAANY